MTYGQAADLCLGFGLGAAVTSFAALVTVLWTIHSFTKGDR